MSTAYSLCIGVEEYLDPKIESVGYAEKDAKAVAAAFNGIGFAKEDQEILLKETATRTSIEFSIKQMMGTALADDTVFLFFSGHGFSNGKENFLVVRDSRAAGLAETSLPLRDVFAQIEKSRCQRVALFLDCCHAGLSFPKAEKSILSTMSSRELTDFFREAEFRVAFGSCKDSEKSYWNDKLGHGVWTHHLLLALTGKVPDILEKGRYLRAAGLQDYLAHEVPRTLRTVFVERKTQSPVFYGSIGRNFLVGDLEPVLPKASPDEALIAERAKKGSFVRISYGSVRSLSGFDRKRGHFVPDRHSQQAESFVAQAGRDEIEREAEDLFDRIKKAFNYARKDITIDHEEGSAIIRANDFDVSLSIGQRKKDAGQYRLELRVDDFSNADIITSDAFNEVFDGEFSSMELKGTAERDIAELIDRIEAARAPGVSITYPKKDPDHVAISFDDWRGTLVVGDGWMEIQLPRSAPREFIKVLRNAQSSLLFGKFAVAGLLQDK